MTPSYGPATHSSTSKIELAIAEEKVKAPYPLVVDHFVIRTITMIRSLNHLRCFAMAALFVASASVIASVEGFTSHSSALSPLIVDEASASIKGKSNARNVVGSIPSGGALRPRAQQPTKTSRFAWPIGKDPKGMSPDYPLTATRIAITVATCYLTWFAQTQYSNVLASSALTLICSTVFDKRLGQAAFCGSFAGMCSTSIIPTKNLALVLGLVTSVCYELLIHVGNAFLGVGGRLGATAFLATSAVAYKTGIKTGLAKYSIAGGARSLKLSALNWETTLMTWAVWHAIGAVATIVLREVSDDSTAADPVRASAVVGLAGALLLQDKTAALAVYGGSFTGMSLPSKLMAMAPSSKRFSVTNVLSLLLTFAIAGAFGGLVHGATLDWKLWTGGWGGKAGFCAFVGCMAYRTMSGIYGMFRRSD